MAAVRVGRSEDEVGEKVDRCLADGLVKTGSVIIIFKALKSF